jgi:class 3 adenylate cyclase
VSAAAAAATSGVVTILITDVEGSTRRWENDADEMRLKLPNMNGHPGGPA